MRLEKKLIKITTRAINIDSTPVLASFGFSGISNCSAKGAFGSSLTICNGGDSTDGNDDSGGVNKATGGDDAGGNCGCGAVGMISGASAVIASAVASEV